jgi:hypothetical protein
LKKFNSFFLFWIKKNHDGSYKYTKNANQDLNKTEHDRHNHREKRQSTSNPFPNGKSECSLYLKADQFLYNLIYKAEGKSVS